MILLADGCRLDIPRSDCDDNCCFDRAIDGLPRVPKVLARDTIGRIIRVTIGLLFSVLCCTYLAVVVGFRPPILVRGLESVHTEWLLISGLCYAVCGWILLNAAQRKSRI